jgi:rapamycin-insensitive companion of mTOR
MSTPMGFRYLYDAGYINREMDMWFHVCPLDTSSRVNDVDRKHQERNIYYVVQVEVFLAKVFSYNSADDYEDVLCVILTLISPFSCG